MHFKKKMKTIPLAEAFKLLKEASSISIEGYITNPSLSDLTGVYENEFLYIGWKDKSNNYYTKFAEGNNLQVDISESRIYLNDIEGDKHEITIFTL
jgi:hypothetical protein